MKMFKLAIAATLVAGSFALPAAPAAAQRGAHNGHHGWHHNRRHRVRVCRVVVRHHRRHRTCRWVWR